MHPSLDRSVRKVVLGRAAAVEGPRVDPKFELER